MLYTWPWPPPARYWYDHSQHLSPVQMDLFSSELSCEQAQGPSWRVSGIAGDMQCMTQPKPCYCSPPRQSHARWPGPARLAALVQDPAAFAGATATHWAWQELRLRQQPAGKKAGKFVGKQGLSCLRVCATWALRLLFRVGRVGGRERSHVTGELKP